ncbi:MAG: [acyl-carrier-protein] S-malonyltransferase [Proteobacteria bacterium]|nr:MAG: [acyl-carrier-protein] S-malonyltransferase [Pseudomonadota bacterium]
MKATYLFPGQGSQAIGMGEDFYNASSDARQIFEEASDALKIDMKKLLFAQNEDLNQTQFSQPAILLVSFIALRLLGKKFNPVFSMGHSLGEFSALLSVGALDFTSALKLVYERGVLMKSSCEGKDAGMMAVIGIEYEKLKNLCDGFVNEGKKIWLANINNASQIVLAGTKKDLKSVEKILSQNGAKRALLLPMSVASHCPLLESALKPFGELLDLYVKDEFQTPIISNVTANLYQDKKTACELLELQLVSSVQYVKSIELAETKSDIFVEFGGSVLKGLNRRITKKPTYSITDMKSLEIVGNL